MPIPTYDELSLPLLELAADGNEHSFAEAVDCLAHRFQLSDAELLERLPSARYPRFRHRVGWAKTDLIKAGLIVPVARARFRITEPGRSALEMNPTKLDRRFLSQFPGFSG